MTDFPMSSISAALRALRGAGARGSTLRLEGVADDQTWSAVLGFPGATQDGGTVRLVLHGLTVALTLAPEPLAARQSVEPAAYGHEGPAAASALPATCGACPDAHPLGHTFVGARRVPLIMCPRHRDREAARDAEQGPPRDCPRREPAEASGPLAGNGARP